MVLDELLSVKDLVKLILDQDEHARNSDNHLYYRIICYFTDRQGVDANAISVTEFFCYGMDYYKIPGFETVRRTRQAVQAQFPELQGKPEVNTNRAKREGHFREFAKMVREG